MTAKYLLQTKPLTFLSTILTHSQQEHVVIELAESRTQCTISKDKFSFSKHPLNNIFSWTDEVCYFCFWRFYIIIAIMTTPNETSSLRHRKIGFSWIVFRCVFLLNSSLLQPIQTRNSQNFWKKEIEIQNILILFPLLLSSNAFASQKWIFFLLEHNYLWIIKSGHNHKVEILFLRKRCSYFSNIIWILGSRLLCSWACRKIWVKSMCFFRSRRWNENEMQLLWLRFALFPLPFGLIFICFIMISIVFVAEIKVWRQIFRTLLYVIHYETL